jgi:hypothetical protein
MSPELSSLINANSATGAHGTGRADHADDTARIQAERARRQKLK